jgi:hypothetical protein
LVPWQLAIDELPDQQKKQDGECEAGPNPVAPGRVRELPDLFPDRMLVASDYFLALAIGELGPGLPAGLLSHCMYSFSREEPLQSRSPSTRIGSRRRQWLSSESSLTMVTFAPSRYIAA